MEQIFHVDKNTGVIGSGSKDQVAVPEGGGHHIRSGRHGHIEHAGLNSQLPQAAGKDLRSVGGVAIDGGIGNDHTGLLRGVGSPTQVLFDELPDVLPPDEAVEGADHFDLQAGSLGQKGCHLGAILTHNVAVIPPGLVQIVPEEIHLIGKQRPVYGAKGAKGVGGEENLLCEIIGHHHLRPVDHRSHDKGIAVVAGLKHVPFLHNLHRGRHVKGEVLGHHIGGLLVAENPDSGIAADHLLNGGGVVRLHMLHHQGVQLPPGQDMVDILKEYPVHAVVHSVKQNRLLIHQKVRIVRHPLGYIIYPFKQSQAAVIPAHPSQILRDLSYTVHCKSPFAACISESGYIIQEAAGKINSNNKNYYQI